MLPVQLLYDDGYEGIVAGFVWQHFVMIDTLARWIVIRGVNETSRTFLQYLEGNIMDNLVTVNHRLITTLHFQQATGCVLATSYSWHQ